MMLRGLVFAAVLIALLPPSLAGQGMRGWASSSVRFFELRPLQLDTVASDQIEVGVDGRTRVDGLPVSCTPGVPCTFLRPGGSETAVVGSQDVGFTAWGLGMTGLSFTGLVRARDRLRGDLDWPLADDPFDVLVGYAQLQRSRFRLRLGRQDTPSGLGFSGFDGAAVRWDGGGWWAEAFGGRSLARGLNETRREALRGIEDFVPDQEAYLWGGAAGARFVRTAVGLRYQREIIADRSGLVAERAALDLSTFLPGALRVEASADYDVPFDRVGKAHLSLQRALFQGRVLAEVTARRYVPYFELSTVWGFFSPVSYREARLKIAAGMSRTAGIEVSLAAREYGDASVSTVFEPLEDRGYQAEVIGRWRPAERVDVQATWQLDWGNSAFLNSLDAAVGLQVHEAVRLRLTGTTFQQFEAFRLGDGRALGGGASLDVRATDRIHVDAGTLILRQDAGRGGSDDVWNQTRGWFGLRYSFGDDPALRRGGR
ncbi:MAG: hypothetical protein HKO98_12060 [Gemmatimonadetes bacterium]|nr:hypothetical protein [Gemmatimonadota bacterium]